MKKSKKIINDDFLVKYIELTTIIILISFINMFINGKSYIYMDIGADTYSSYWPTYIFFQNMITNGEFSFWSFSRGLGESIFSTFQLLFDPYNIILFLFNSKYMDIGITIVSIFKMYTLSIISFLYFKKIGIKKNILVLTALCYTFNGYYIGWGQHYNFASMFVMFTLLLYSFECCIIDGNFKLLSISTLLICINSVYFAYMIAIFMFFYLIIRYYFEFKKQYSIWEYIICIFKPVILGVSLSSIIFIPYILSMLSAPRVGMKTIPTIDILDIKELVTIVMRFFSNNLLGINEYLGYVNYYESPFLFVGVLGTILIPSYIWITRKQKKTVIIASIITIAIIFPSFSNPIMNALSAYTYRWTFCLIPVFCIAIAKSLQIVIDNIKYKNVYSIFAIINVTLLLGYYIFLNLNNNLNYEKDIVFTDIKVILLILVSYIVVFRMFTDNNKSTLASLLLFILIFDLGNNAFISINKRSLITHEYAINSPYFDESNMALEQIIKNDHDWYRVSKDYAAIDLLDPIVQGYKGEKLYSSTISSPMLELMNVYDLKVKNSNYFYGFLENSDLKNILSFKYLLSKNNLYYDNHTIIDNKRDINIFKNEIYFPFGFIYNNCIYYDDFEKLNKIDKQMIMYDAFVTEEPCQINSLKNYSYLEKQKVISSNIRKISEENIIINDFPRNLSINALSNDLKIEIDLTEKARNSSVINFEMNAQKDTKGKVYIFDSEGLTDDGKSIEFEVKEGKHEYYINIPTIELDKFTISIPNYNGEINILNFKVFEKDYSKIKANLNNSKKIIIESYKEDAIIGNIDINEDSMLFLPIPFDNNWEIKVDDKSVEKKKINISFIGIELKAGFHKISINYIPKGLFLGAAITTITLLYLVFNFIKKRIYSKK